MSTTELKKLAEAANLTLRQLADMNSDEFFEADQLRSRFRKESPAAILELLQINAELVEALKLAQKALDAIGDEMTVGERYTNAGQYLIDTVGPIKDALAKAEGGEL